MQQLPVSRGDPSAEMVPVHQDTLILDGASGCRQAWESACRRNRPPEKRSAASLWKRGGAKLRHGAPQLSRRSERHHRACRLPSPSTGHRACRPHHPRGCRDRVRSRWAWNVSFLRLVKGCCGQRLRSGRDFVVHLTPRELRPCILSSRRTDPFREAGNLVVPLAYDTVVAIAKQSHVCDAVTHGS
jgi:hypothetical protein